MKVTETIHTFSIHWDWEHSKGGITASDLIDLYKIAVSKGVPSNAKVSLSNNCALINFTWNDSMIPEYKNFPKIPKKHFEFPDKNYKHYN